MGHWRGAGKCLARTGNFLRQEKVRNVLASLNLTPQEINQKNCLRAVANAVVGKEDPQKKRAAARLAKIKAGAGAGQKPDGQREGLNRLLSDPVSEPDGEERNAREEQQSKGLAAERTLQMQVLSAKLGRLRGARTDRSRGC